MYAAKGASPFAGFRQTSCVKRQKTRSKQASQYKVMTFDVLTFDALASGNARFKAKVTFRQATLAVTFHSFQTYRVLQIRLCECAIDDKIGRLKAGDSSLIFDLAPLVGD